MEKKYFFVHSKIQLVDGFEKMVLWIERGMANGAKIDFTGGARDYQDRTPSDLVFKVVELPHKKYKRRGSNLLTNMKISLKEAQLGFKRTITSLDNRQIVVQNDGYSFFL